MDDSVIFHRWTEAVQAAYRLAHASRTADLYFRPVKRFDSRGVHPFSEECGRIAELQQLMPELRNAGFDPVLLRREAEKDATEQFVREAA